MELFIGPGNTETFLLRLIISYLKLEQRGSLKVIALSDPALKAVSEGKLALKVPSLVTKTGEVLDDSIQIARHLVSLQPAWQQFFLGASQQERGQISNIKAHYKQGKQLRKYLQKHLESRTFFVGNHVTLADLAMFCQLYDNVVEMTDEQKNQYNNLFRWYKHIQNLPEVTAFLRTQNRLLVADPEPKLAFLEVKKKKEKKEK